MSNALRELLSTNDVIKAKLDSIGVRHQSQIRWSVVRFISGEDMRVTYHLTHIHSSDYRDQFIIQLYGDRRLIRELQPIIDNIVANLPKTDPIKIHYHNLR